jgi:hypothetical protein
MQDLGTCFACGPAHELITQALWQQLLAALPKLSKLQMFGPYCYKTAKDRRLPSEDPKKDTASAAIAQLAQACAAVGRRMELHVCGQRVRTALYIPVLSLVCYVHNTGIVCEKIRPTFGLWPH